MAADLGPVEDPESFDDYDDSENIGNVPRLRLVDPDRKVGVLVEALASGFWVSRLRNDGTTVASVHWTREELSELVSRAQAALEM